ncbi:unnamed protein product [Toxocara canis]|uniref:DUF3039 domain-containing protein n=1 Tax=Toxocara canis TaxID=6265 RepID=A0A183TVB4_TOXCA|nr:unnamed protein product [Toxocara canis]
MEAGHVRSNRDEHETINGRSGGRRAERFEKLAVLSPEHRAPLFERHSALLAPCQECVDMLLWKRVAAE